MRSPRLKRIIDIAIAAAALIVCALPLLLIAAIVRLTMGRPVLFRQIRPGRNEVPFTLIKVRTMRHQPQAGSPLPDGERITRFGAFLRRTSLDELPELWNVLRGDMAIVGPRPLLIEYLPHYDDRQRRRHEMRPGITGLAQVSGRNRTSWAERLERDVVYVDTWSLVLDAAIVLRTARAVLRRDGISAEGHATMPRLDAPGEGIN